MNTAAHQIAECFVNHAVADQAFLAGKIRRDDQQPIVTAATLGALMTSVPRRIVDQFQANRRQDGESLADDRLAVGGKTGALRIAHAGRAFLNGLTVTAW